MQIGLQYYLVVDYSPTCDDRVTHSRRANPTGALIHSTGGVNSRDWLLSGSAASGTPASANELIGRSGEVSIICPTNRYPYHAGKSRAFIGGKWLAGDQVSETFYGWEIEQQWAELPTYQQIDSLAQRIVEIGIQYAWRWPYIILGHYGVATPIGRKTDPWLFDWGSLMGRLYVTARAHYVPGL
jgi:N-acetyl-anhydromuramyl-L-alanine amidase AmpD